MSSGTSNYRTGHQLAMSLRGAHAYLRRRTNLALSGFGMTADQYVLLSVLADRGAATQQELVRSCYSDTATVGTMLLLLESGGLLTRTPHPEDGRARTVKLSPKGRRLEAALRRTTTAVRSEMTALFTRRELTLLTQLLGRLATAMSPPPRTTTLSRSPRSKRLGPSPRKSRRAFFAAR